MCLRRYAGPVIGDGDLPFHHEVEVALRIARAQGGVIVNADAIQVYANWRVLTARPSEAEEAELPHRLFGHIARDEDYSVGHWLREVGAGDNSQPRIPGLDRKASGEVARGVIARGDP